MATKPPLRRVAVLVDTSTSWGRLVVTGVHHFTRRRHRWQLFLEARGTEEHPQVPRNWHGDGIIARIGTLAMAQELRALRLPIVNVSGIQLPGVNLPRVNNDLPAGAQMAAQYFRNNGFRHFAYFSLLGLPYVAAQQEAFRAAVQQAGGDYSVYGVETHAGAEPDWNLNLEQLAAWLKSLPKPVGLLTWNADSGRQIIYACQHAHLRVPEDIALLSGSDDDLLCEMSHIPISAVRVASEHIGQRAAAVLDDLMHGRPGPSQPILVPPLGIIERRSTDIIPLRDRLLVAALTYIRANAARPIQVTDVARRTGVSRRVLERRFLAKLGRTPATEIRRVHRERAQQWLRETSWSIPVVAKAAGFGSPEYMAYVFNTELGQSPLKYRKQFRPA